MTQYAKDRRDFWAWVVPLNAKIMETVRIIILSRVVGTPSAYALGYHITEQPIQVIRLYDTLAVSKII